MADCDRPSSLGHLPAGDRWAFDESVTDVFDDMIARSIPQYAEMRRLVTALAARYVRRGSDVVDLGCSRGDAMAALVARFGPSCRFVGIEVAPPMLAAVRERFAAEIAAGYVEIRDDDLRSTYPKVEASVTLCVLALQFTPIEHRLHILRRIYESTLASGGALILVEKVIGASAEIDRVLVDEYLETKRRNGYSEDEIQRKRLALEGVLVPVTAKWNEELLRVSGFRDVDCVWRSLNFAAWLAIR